MADVQAAESDLLHQKWGPMPVWAWALTGLVVAWLYSKYKATKQAATSSSTAANAQQDQPVAPQWIINEGGTATTVNVPSAPVPPPGVPTPVTTPPGTNPGPPVKTGPPPPHPPVTHKPGPAKQPVVYRVQPGDNLTSIANRFHVKGGAAALYNYQLSSPLRSAQAKAEIRARGMNHLVSNEEILIPPQ